MAESTRGPVGRDGRRKLYCVTAYMCSCPLFRHEGACQHHTLLFDELG